MDSKRTSKLETLLKVAHAKKQAGIKVPIAELLKCAKLRQAKKASAITPPSLYCRLAASMAKTAEQETEKTESPKTENPKSESSKSESPKSSSTPAKPAAPKPSPSPTTTPKPATSPTPTAGQGALPGFDWQSVLKNLQHYAAPTAVGAGVGALGSLMLPQGTNPGESALQYQRRQRNRMIGGGLVGGGTAAALLAAYNAYKARKGMVAQ
jgi:hypothetical protein